MKLAILGTRGIPNYHGGFEQFAEFFSVYLVHHNIEVYVYNSSLHPYDQLTYKGVNIIQCKDFEDTMGTAGQFLYDFNCIMDSRKRNFDVILQLGYTSSSIWFWLLPKTPIIITNMDGLEWKRSKYNAVVQRFLKFAERLAVNSSNYLISDSIGIQNYLTHKYGVNSEYIAYGAEQFTDPNIRVLDDYKVQQCSYNLLIARMEPENNIETILDGASRTDFKFLVIGKYDVNDFGRYLKKKYIKNENIIFLGGIYDLNKLNNLRYYSNLYFHGHSVGGTNPSLLEAMASKALIVAHDNEFNKAILKENAFYFKTYAEVEALIKNLKKDQYSEMIERCYKEIQSNFNWDLINEQYLSFIRECYSKV